LRSSKVVKGRDRWFVEEWREGGRREEGRVGKWRKEVILEPAGMAGRGGDKIAAWAADDISGPEFDPTLGGAGGGVDRPAAAKQPHSSILQASASGAKEMTAAERRERRLKERQARGEATYVFKKNNQLPPLDAEPGHPGTLASGGGGGGGGGGGTGSMVVFSSKGGEGPVSASGRRSSVEEGGIGATSRWA